MEAVSDLLFPKQQLSVKFKENCLLKALHLLMSPSGKVVDLLLTFTINCGAIQKVLKPIIAH